MRSIVLMGWGLVALLATAGCSNLLGIEEWQDPVAIPQETEDDAGSDGAPISGDPCTDKLQNGKESGVDCGGDVCPKCLTGSGCDVDGDCESGYCPEVRGYCTIDDGRGACDAPNPQNPNCADCVKNNDETDIDCGGACAPCRPGKACGNDGDCWSSVCDLTAVPATCGLSAQGASCYTNEDCQSGSCGSTGCATSGACCH